MKRRKVNQTSGQGRGYSGLARVLAVLALLMTVATGAMAQTTVNGLFTVNADGDQVQFASGNLRYTSGAWSFFDHQYDYYDDYSDDSWDKFGWSTSGTTYGMSTSTNESQYKGDFVDWGNAVGTGWRTLSNDEWAYVLNTRSGSTIGPKDNARFAKAVVCDVKGLIIFPDDYAHPNGVTAPTGINDTGETGMNGNSYDATAWGLMESAGCVFLPAAGGRYNQNFPTLVVNVGNEGCYWSSTSNNSIAYFLSFRPYTFNPSSYDSPRVGNSVRLVKSVTTYAVSLKAETADGANWTIASGQKSAKGDAAGGLTGLKEKDAVTLTYKGRLKVKSVTATTDAAPAEAPAIDYSTAQLGDLFYSDGTFSSTLEAGKTPIGVIAYLDQDGTGDDEICEKSNGAGHGLVLCLKDAASGADALWSTEKSAFEFGEDAKVADVNALKRTTNVSGYTNTKTLAEKTDAATKYKAAYAAKNYAGLTAPTGTTGWFLPSAQQWVKMQTGLGALEESVFTWNSWFDTSHTAADKWEAALSKAGSGNYDSMTSAYLFCWSSSEYSVSSAVGLYVGAMGTGNNYGFRWLFRTKDSETSGNRVRPVLAF